MFDVKHQDKTLGEIRAGLPGDHYVRNALAAVAIGLELDIPFEAIKRGIEDFEGVGRRFEIKGDAGGVTVVDDYGHHPTEIAATILAARQSYNKRLMVFFQPHRYTRTQALAEQFGNCFAGAHTVFITDIYAAGEAPIPGVSSDLIIEGVRRAGGIEVYHAASFDHMVELAMERVKDGDLVLTLGAGDIYKVGEMLLQRLEEGG